MSQWKRVGIADVCESITDCINKTAPKINEPSLFKMIRTTNVRNGRVNLESVKYVTEETYHQWTRRQVPQIGDVLLTREAPMGEAGMLLSDEHVFLGQRIVSYRVDRSKLNNHFLLYALRSDNLQSQIKSCASGSTVKHMRVPDTKTLQVPLPSLSEQKRIVEILDAADALRVKRREAIAQLDALLQSTFLTLFGDPEQWSEISVESLAQSGRGMFSNGPFGSNLLTSELTDVGIPVVYIRDIRNGEYQRVSKVCVTEEKAAELESCQTLPGDVLIAKVGDPPGISAVYPADEPLGIITQDVIRIRPDLTVVTPTFLTVYLNSVYGKRQIQEITVEATRARFGLRGFKGQKMPLPPLDLQNHFATIVQSIEKQKAHQRAHLAELDTLFAALQSRAFRGEL